jgi:voltage-gated potassium channel
MSSTKPRWRARLHEIIFEADTPAGKAFDIALLVCIVLSVLAVLLESVATIREQYGQLLRSAGGHDSDASFCKYCASKL